MELWSKFILNFVIIDNNLSSFSSNNVKSPKNFNKAKKIKTLNFLDISNKDKNIFDINVIGESGQKKKKHLINFNLSFDEVKYNPDIKINKNYNINIINHKKVHSSNNFFYNDTGTYSFNNNNYNIKCFNYIPLAVKKEKGIINIDSL